MLRWHIFITSQFFILGLTAQEESYIWDIDGTSLYALPTVFSEKIDDFKFGQKIIYQLLDTSIETTQRKSTGYALKREMD